MTMQDKHRPCQDGMISDTASKQEESLLQPCAEIETSVQQYACNYIESCHDKTKMCDLVTRREFYCLQEISKLSGSVLDCLAVQNQAFAWWRQKKHALTFLISEYNWLHFTTTEGRGNVHANTAASTSTKKTCLHPTADSALQPIVLMVVNILRPMVLTVAVPWL